MIFSTKNLWLVCESLRTANNLSFSELSRKVFEDRPSSFYGTKYNRLNGGVSIPFKVLQYFGITKLVFQRYNPQTDQTITLDLVLKNKTITEITKSLVYIIVVFSYDVNEIALPQTLRKAMHEDDFSSLLGLKTFTKAFSLLPNTSFEVKNEISEMF